MLQRLLALLCALQYLHLLVAQPPASPACSLTFELPYGQRKCFSEDFPASTMVRGTVHVASGHGEMKLDLFVSDSRGVVQFHKADVDTVKFSFRTSSNPNAPHSRELYSFCMLNQVHPNAGSGGGKDVVRRVTLSVDTVHKKDGGALGRVARQGHVDKVYASFLAVSNEVDNLIQKMDELRAQEQLLSDVNERTATTILRISLVACVFTIATGFINFISLKTFFKRKKLA